MLKQRWPWFLGAFVVVAIAFLFVTSANGFRYCIDHGGEYPANQNANYEPIGGLISGDIRINITCIGGFANAYGVAITALATLLLMFVTGGLVFLGWRQLTTARAQLRAYVFPENGGLMEGTILTPPQPAHAGEPGFYLVYRNTGQTPARDVVTWARIDVIEPRHEATLVVPQLQKVFSRSLGASGNTSQALWFGTRLNQQEIQDIAADRKRIYVFGRTEYVDVFGISRYTDFRYYYTGAFPNRAGMSLLTTERGNDFS